MKSLLLAWRTAVWSAFNRTLSTFSAKISGVLSGALYSRPALKRGLLVLLLFGVPALPLTVLFGAFAPATWGLVLGAVFLGLGAERASTDWDDMFALPAPRNFKFWHWHALERKRYLAVLAALITGQILVLISSMIWGGI